MAFTAKDWKDYPDTSTPISASALEDLETRVVQAGLQLNTGTNKKVAYGKTVMTTGFGGQSTTTYSIAHGLGTTPAVVVATADAISIGGTQEHVLVSANSSGHGSTNLNFELRIASGATTSLGTVIHWIAIA